MPIIRSTIESGYTLENNDYGPDQLGVVSFQGTEHISWPYEYEIELAVKFEVDFDKIIGQTALLSLVDGGDNRLIHGIINRFEYMQQGPTFYRYRATLVPRLWLLSVGEDSRIFQEMTVPEIIEKVLKDAGIRSDQYRLNTNRSYSPREYCVQYSESNLNFISRLMEEEGIFYFFEHTNKDHILVIGDHQGANVPIDSPDTIVYRESTGGVGTNECIEEFNYSNSIRVGKIVLNDYNFKKPALDLKAEDNADKDKELEVYEYPGEYEDSSEGKDLAKLRIEELQVPRKTSNGKINTYRLIPGYRFSLDEHPQDTCNIEYLITSVTNNGYQPQTLEEEAGASGEEVMQESRFETIPASVPYRSPRETERVRMQGIQTAVVVGPSGEEIYTDKHGRVKVQFHWDRQGKRDEKSSCWIRVAQLWAGAGWGAMFIPRIGQEVIVDFIEGDPDRPIITGRVYNGEQTPPYPLPADKTKSTIKSDSTTGGGGSNEFRFEDKKGSEEIYLHGQKDWTIAIDNDKNQTVGNNESLSVGNNRTKTVGTDQSESIGANKSIEVGADHTEQIGANKTLNVGSNHTEAIGANMSLAVGSNKTETVSINSAETVGAAKELSIGAVYQVTVGAAMNETVGAAKAEEVGAAKSVNIGANSSENVGGNKSVDTGGNISEKAGKDVSIQSGKKMSLSAGDDFSIKGDKKGVIEIKDKLTIKCGSASITLKKNGDISIKGKKISIKGSGDVKIKGSKIGEN